MDIISVYNDFLFEINKTGGSISGADFNGISKRAELKFLDWISGKLTGEMPQPYVMQKNRDWLSPLIKKNPVQVTGGKIEKPDDYYGYENSYLMGDYYKQPECDTDNDDEGNGDPGTVTSDCNVPIELLSNSKFYTRCQTYIKGLAPSFLKPIAKMVGNDVEFAPKDLGSITLEYVRYPVYGEIKMVPDPVYKDEVPEKVKDYEWGEYAREYLIWFMIDLFSNSTRESALKNANLASRP